MNLKTYEKSLQDLVVSKTSQLGRCGDQWRIAHSHHKTVLHCIHL